MADLLDVPEGYDYHAPKIDVPPRVFWLNRLFRFLLAALLASSTWLAHGRPPLDTVALVALTLNQYPALYILVAFSSLGIYPVHEVLHGFGGYLYGLKTRFGWDWYSLAPFVTTYGRPQTRFETAFITLMPLVSLTVVFTPIVLFGSDLAAVVILPALLVNILGSGTDLNTAWKMWSLPDGALLQHDYDENTAYYVPSH